MFKNLFKDSLNILTILTGMAVVLFFVLPGDDSIALVINKHPTLSLIVGVILIFWAIMLLVISLILTFSEKKRDQAFYATANIAVRDELEEKSVADAIKRTFLFNLTILALVFSLSGFFYGSYKKENGKIGLELGYTLLNDMHTEDPVLSAKRTIKNLKPEIKEILTKGGFTVEDSLLTKETVHYIIPRKLFSPFGILCFIFLQFFMFKFFLLLNLRALNSEE